MNQEETEELLNKCNKIEGWLSENEFLLLHNLAKVVSKENCIVEIGSWKGKSTVALGLGSLAGNKPLVFAVDHHTGSKEHQTDGHKVWTYPEFIKNMKKHKVEKVVRPLIMPSCNAVNYVNKPVELIFIDGAHDFESVLWDWNTWLPLVMPGGLMCFHDSNSWPGVMKLMKLDDFKSHFDKIELVGSITLAVKKGGKP